MTVYTAKPNPQIEALVPGDKVAVFDGELGVSYRIVEIATVSSTHLTLKYDSADLKFNKQFDKLSGDEVWGPRRFRLLPQARLEKELGILLNQATLILSEDQLNRCKQAFVEILDETA